MDGKRGDHVLLGPPYTCTDEEIDLIAAKTISCISDFFTNQSQFSNDKAAITNTDTIARAELDPLYEPEEGTLLVA